MTPHYERGQLLYQQGRYDLAAKQLREHLAACPNDPLGHALLGVTLMRQRRLQEADHEARTAVRLGPDCSYAHYALACVLHESRWLKEAAAAVTEAIRLDPECADYFDEWARVLLNQQQSARAARMARRGLAIDPQHVGCANTLGLALTEAGRYEEARSVLERALARDPTDAFTHTNLGKALLGCRDTPRALEHFREALRLDPNSDTAREGFVEALKARNPVYRFLLRLLLWAARGDDAFASFFFILLILSAGALGVSFAGEGLTENDRLPPALLALILGSVATAPFVAGPLFDLLLHFDRLGRLSLTRAQVWASYLMSGCVLAAVVGATAGVATNQFGPITVGAAFLFLTVPMAVAFRCEAGSPRLLMFAYTAILAVVGPGGLAVAAMQPRAERPAVIVRELPRVRPASPPPAPGTVIAVLFIFGVLFSGAASEMVTPLPPRR